MRDQSLAQGRTHVCRRRRRDDCACGGQIYANPHDPDEVAAKVRAHQRTKPHDRWRIANGFPPRRDAR